MYFMLLVSPGSSGQSPHRLAICWKKILVLSFVFLFDVEMPRGSDKIAAVAAVGQSVSAVS